MGWRWPTRRHASWRRVMSRRRFCRRKAGPAERYRVVPLWWWRSQFRAGCDLRETWAREDTARGSDFLSDTPLRAGPPGSALSQHEELSSCVPAWPSVVDGWMATTEPPKIEARRKVPRGAASATAPPAASWWRETCTRDFTARGSDLSHTPLRAGPPASMISRGGPGCSSFRRSGPGRPSLSLRSKACGVVVLVVAWAARDAARAVACATARAGTAGRWARTKERVGGGL